MASRGLNGVIPGDAEPARRAEDALAGGMSTQWRTGLEQALPLR
jgi:hypothetical protein